MDCLFNLQIPKSTKNRVIVPPASKTFINGMANSYSMKYPSEYISSMLNSTDFLNIMQDINENICSFWPCCFCHTFGYGCALCTLGLSFFGPYICISEAQEHLEQRIRYWNRTFLAARNVKLSLNFGCSTSWLCFERVEPDKSLEMVVIKESEGSSETGNEDSAN
eukprot:TRINITY_DN17144_c0_g2_i1.p2 TRINITY_DN17144_c0_g2~~TRINITY_DN17144_c0_g2_i1.p2  ORF type:complete len:165 (+),score=33.81 TRINITY_DN17144_c0_g2_i1:134-628(+)